MCVAIKRQMDKTNMNQNYWLTATPLYIYTKLHKLANIMVNVVMISDVRVYCNVILYLFIRYIL